MDNDPRLNSIFAIPKELKPSARKKKDGTLIDEAKRKERASYIPRVLSSTEVLKEQAEKEAKKLKDAADKEQKKKDKAAEREAKKAAKAAAVAERKMAATAKKKSRAAAKKKPKSKSAPKRKRPLAAISSSSSSLSKRVRHVHVGNAAASIVDDSTDVDIDPPLNISWRRASGRVIAEDENDNKDHNDGGDNSDDPISDDSSDTTDDDDDASDSDEYTEENGQSLPTRRSSRLGHRVSYRPAGSGTSSQEEEAIAQQLAQRGIRYDRK